MTRVVAGRANGTQVRGVVGSPVFHFSDMINSVGSDRAARKSKLTDAEIPKQYEPPDGAPSGRVIAGVIGVRLFWRRLPSGRPMKGLTRRHSVVQILIRCLTSWCIEQIELDAVSDLLRCNVETQYAIGTKDFALAARACDSAKVAMPSRSLCCKCCLRARTSCAEFGI